MHKINSKVLARLLLQIEGVVIQLENNNILVAQEKSLLINLKKNLKRYLDSASKEMAIDRYLSDQQYIEVSELIRIADKLIIQAQDAKLISTEYIQQYDSLKTQFEQS